MVEGFMVEGQKAFDQPVLEIPSYPPLPHVHELLVPVAER